MKKSKAVLVTIVMTLMLVVILAFLFLTGVKVLFYIFAGIFGVLGIVCADFWLLDWLTEEDEPEELEPVLCNQENNVPPEVSATVEEIMDEVRQG